MESFEVNTCKGKIIYLDNKNVVISGTIDDNVVEGKIQVMAACPIDKKSSYSGSGLPFASVKQAFDNTPNRKEFELSLHNKFEVEFMIPNSYYIGLGTVLVPPTVFLRYSNGDHHKVIQIQLCGSIPYRTLTYPISNEHASRSGPQFYDVNLPHRTQEQILRDSAYPKQDELLKYKIPSNFWGLKPPK